MEKCESSGGDYSHTGSGENNQGNHWCSFQGKNGNNGYHYYNSDGSYYQKNTDGSARYDNGRGYGWTQATTSPGGNINTGKNKGD